MPAYDRLPLLRYTRDEPRRKKPGFSTAVPRNPGSHGAKLRKELDTVIAAAAAAPGNAKNAPILIYSEPSSAPSR